MTENTPDLDEAIKLLAGLQEPHAFLIPREHTQEETERPLGLKLPPSYCRFLSAVPDSSAPLPAGDMLKENLEARQAVDAPGSYLPEFLVAFYQDGSGNQYCFDTRDATEEGEYPIVFWDHELTTEEKLAKLTVTEPMFEKWLVRYSCEKCPPNPKTTWLDRVGVGGCACGCVVVAVLLIFGLVTFVEWLWQFL